MKRECAKRTSGVLDLEDPRIKTLLELRKELEEEIDRLQERIERLENFLHALDATIGARSFATADTILRTTSPTTTGSTTEPSVVKPAMPRVEELLNKTRDLQLATMEVSENEIKILPAPHASYDIKRGAFASFFLEETLGKFQREDRHRVENGEIEWAEAFDFEVKSEDGVLTGIIIRNYGGEERLQEIQRRLRWALEKIYRER